MMFNFGLTSIFVVVPLMMMSRLPGFWGHRRITYLKESHTSVIAVMNGRLSSQNQYMG